MRGGSSRNGSFKKGTTSMDIIVAWERISGEKLPSACPLHHPHMASDATEVVTTPLP
jgi:hypothetical protein